MFSEMTADDDDVPPLEDCSAIIAHANELRKTRAVPRPPSKEAIITMPDVLPKKEVKEEKASSQPTQPKVRTEFFRYFFFKANGKE